MAPIIFYVQQYPEGKTLLSATPNVVSAHVAMAARESFEATAPQLG